MSDKEGWEVVGKWWMSDKEGGREGGKIRGKEGGE